MKQYFEGSKPKRHCNQVIAFEKDGAWFVHCRKCKEWVRLPEAKGKEKHEDIQEV